MRFSTTPSIGRRRFVLVGGAAAAGARKAGSATVSGAKKVGEDPKSGAKKVGEGAKKLGDAITP